MGLFSNKQEYVNHHRVPSETEKAIRNLKKRCNDLEEKIESLAWRDSIVTADEATAQLEAKIQAEMPKELGKVFEKIRKAIDKKENSITIPARHVQREPQDNSSVCHVFSYNSYLEDLEQELKKYKYATHLTDNGLVVAWPRKKVNTPVIDPDKKYILPMEKFEGNVLYGRYKWYAFKNEEGFWNSFAHISNEQAMGNYAVQGKDILNAPDWVKAIKPIEVKE
ncbi:hypothetical protein [Limosilactobacillus reuteri]|uniref:hypothetical protein n=1 Tax=Limosilactobacillus reuteri TaxID=1598 RepID=UPI001C0C6DA1|nr:hypothetical protein [Limosilactobacillus reuteri]QWS05311.1 hypothetical protein I6U32_11900 [Limosilactobacillus reuteri]